MTDTHTNKEHTMDAHAELKQELALTRRLISEPGPLSTSDRVYFQTRVKELEAEIRAAREELIAGD